VKYKLILFDADDTLFDFRKGERLAFWSTCEAVGVNATEEIFAGYRKINDVLWKKFDQNLITKDEIKVSRYQQVFKEFKIAGDPEFAGNFYLDALSQQHHLFDEALATCTQLKAHARLALVTNGIDFVQRRRVALSLLRDHFDLLVVSEECGFQKPDVRIFEYTLKRAQHVDRETVLMVGDRLETDILGGLNAGISTCWYNPMKLANESEIKPHFEISRLAEILTL
jgi:YjjG family noncanonical pyrimidine nucleotidase